jgi:predicted RNase H-like HicB family nuclease
MAIPEGFFKPGEEVPSGDDILEMEVGYIDGYRMVYARLAHNWTAISPDVPDIISGGATRAEAEERMREGLPAHLALSDEPMPELATAG